MVLPGMPPRDRAPSDRPAGDGHSPGDELQDAREALAYWERRVLSVPRRAVRDRREARENIHRWELRVVEAERARYGRGVGGALVMLGVERRLPEAVRRGGQRMARRTKRTLTAIVVATVAATVVVIDLVVRALSGLFS